MPNTGIEPGTLRSLARRSNQLSNAAKYAVLKKKVLSTIGHFIDDTTITKAGVDIMPGQVSRFGNCVLNKP